MPLFHKNEKDKAPAEPEKASPPPKRSSTLFSKRNSTATNHSVSSAKSTKTSATTPSTTSRHSVLHRHEPEDASISTARERVVKAEAAEREADRALIQARKAVEEARAHVRRIEAEAAEEARLARIKQEQAHSISKRAKPLGRHNN